MRTKDELILYQPKSRICRFERYVTEIYFGDRIDFKQFRKEVSVISGTFLNIKFVIPWIPYSFDISCRGRTAASYIPNLLLAISEVDRQPIISYDADYGKVKLKNLGWIDIL